MSPEQRRGDDLDARSDVPACGIVLYELATEQLPFTSNRPHFPALEAPQRTACILHIARPRGFEPSRGGDPSDAVGDDRRGRPSGQDGPTTKPSAIATSVKHTEDLHRFVVLAEVDEIRKSLEHDAPKATVRDRERTWRRERARGVDFVDELWCPRPTRRASYHRNASSMSASASRRTTRITSNRGCGPSPRTSC